MRAREFIVGEDRLDEFLPLAGALGAIGRAAPAVTGAIGRAAPAVTGAIGQALTNPAVQQFGKQALNVGGNILNAVGNAALSGLAKIGAQPQIKNAFLIVDGQPLSIDLNNSQQRTALINLYKTFQK